MLDYGLLGPHINDSTIYLFWIGIIGSLIVSYLLGSINSAILISKLVYRDDIRKHGSGNAGLTNMHRTFGLGAAGLTLLGDMLKTVISVLIPMILFGFTYDFALCTNPISYLAGRLVTYSRFSMDSRAAKACSSPPQWHLSYPLSSSRCYSLYLSVRYGCLSTSPSALLQ